MLYANSVIKWYSTHVNISCFSRVLFVEDWPASFREDYSQDSENVARSDSVSRAKQKIYDIAMLNDFEYFVTFTFNDKIVSGYDYEESMKRVKTWCKNGVQRNGLKYLFVPELHPSSGRIHLHGMISFEETPDLFDSGYRDKSGRIVYNLPSWSYGFSTCIGLDDRIDKVSAYILKYVTKDVSKITGNFYYAGGKGLLREPEKEYWTFDYDDFSGEEHMVYRDGQYIGLKVKYSMLPIEKAAFLGFIKMKEGEDF